MFFCQRNAFKKMFSKNISLLIGIAIFGNVLPFNLISLSEIYVDSIVASTLIGTMPLFTLLISFLLFKGNELNLFSFFGLSVGFFGMVTFINPSNLSIQSTTISFSSLIIFSSFCYGLSANLVKKIKNNTPLEIATFSTVWATILSFPVFVSHLFFSRNSEIYHLQNISLESFLSASVLGVVCTGLAILIFFNLIKTRTAVFASQSNYLIPCFGSIWGFLFLGESLSQNMFYGLLLIVLGGWMINRSMTNK